MKKLLLSVLLASMSSATYGHEVWLERDGDGPVRIYLGEPADVLPEGGDPEFSKLKSPRLLSGSGATQQRKAGFIEVTAPAGDVRVIDDNVFAPWGTDGKKEGIVYYARAGRTQPRAAMPFEIVPAAPNGDRFLLMREGKPVPATAITVISPDKWTKALTTDAAGAFIVPTRGKGRYLLSAATKDQGTYATPAGSVDVLHRITTTTFVVP